MKKIIALTVALVLSLALAACGSSGNYSAATEEYSMSTAPQMMDSGSGQTSSNGISNSVTMPSDNRKIILNASIDMQTETYDATCAALEKAVGDAGGYISSTYQYDASYNNSRSASYEFRIPSKKYQDFIVSISTAGTVTSKNETTDDITSQYVDVEARLKSLNMQQDRLYELLETATDIDTLLAIQNQLSEVQYQIENYTSQQRTYDNLIDYATVSVSVDEVNRVTEQPATFAQRIGTAFTESWYNFGDWCQDFAVWFVSAIPALLVLAVIVLIAVRIGLTVHNKNVTKRQKLASAAVPKAQAASYSPLYAPAPAPQAPPKTDDENKEEE